MVQEFTTIVVFMFARQLHDVDDDACLKPHSSVSSWPSHTLDGLARHNPSCRETTRVWGWLGVAVTVEGGCVS